MVDAIETVLVYATTIFLVTCFPWPVHVIFLISYYTIYFVVQGRGAGR